MTKSIYDHIVKDSKMNEISIGAFKEKRENYVEYL